MEISGQNKNMINKVHLGLKVLKGTKNHGLVGIISKEFSELRMTVSGHNPFYEMRGGSKTEVGVVVHGTTQLHPEEIAAKLRDGYGTILREKGVSHVVVALDRYWEEIPLNGPQYPV